MSASKRDFVLPAMLSETEEGSGGEDGMLFQLAKARWYLGEWEALTHHDMKTVASAPDREGIALLVACAHAQIGAPHEAERWLRTALSWGCSPRLAAKLLVSGLQNTLGRIAALRRDDVALKRHFEAAFEISDAPDVEVASHARALREMARLGLLPQAADFIQQKLQSTMDAHHPGRQRAQIEMLRTELELVRHELTLALRRGQVVPRDALASAPRDAQGNIANRSVSQLGQDLWVLERTGYKRAGFFVEFGATDGVSLSNTYLLETEFGWDGICAEPNPKFFAELKKNRRCRVSRDCIGARTGEEVEFVFADAYGGALAHISSDMHAERRRPYLADSKNIQCLKTVSLSDFLKKHGAPSQIDYLSIDTEGSEFEILSTFPFEEWTIMNITVEHNFTPLRQAIKDLLCSKGYQCHEADWDDWYFR
jgi:FkbM family methyltransferase